MGVAVDGDTLIKCQPSGWGNAGAVSDQVLYGDGALEFVAMDQSDRTCGLSDENIDNQGSTIDYAIKLHWVDTYGHRVTILESGTTIGTFGSYVIGDRFTIERTGSTIVYKKNDTILYTSETPSSGPLIADAAIYSVGGTVADARMLGGRGTDLDHDWDVDADDRALLMQDMGRTDCPQGTDLNADGLVDENDLTIFNARPEGNYGYQTPLGPTYVGGAIREDTVWSLQGSPYIVSSSASVYGTETTPATLTIEPGVRVQFAGGTSLTFGSGTTYFGALRAIGTEAAPILFTSNASSPAAGDWRGIRFGDATHDTTTIMDHCVVEYAAQYGGTQVQSSIFCYDASPTIQNTIIRNSLYRGMYLIDASPAITGCTITDSGTHGIYLQLSSPTIRSSTIAHSGQCGIYLYGASTPIIGAEGAGNTISDSTTYPISCQSETPDPTIAYNTITNWGSNALCIGAGGIRNVHDNAWSGGTMAVELLGEHINENTTLTDEFNPYSVSGAVIVRHSQASNGTDPSKIATLTIEPGVTVKFASGAYLTIGYTSSGNNYYGALSAVGTEENPIVFTSTAATPAAGNWKGVRFVDQSHDATTILDHCIVEYGGQDGGTAWRSNVFCSSAAPTIQHSTIRNSLYHGIHLTGAASSGAALSCNELESNRNGILTESSANPVIHQNNITGSSECGVKNSTTGITINAQENYWWGNTADTCGTVDSSNPQGTAVDCPE